MTIDDARPSDDLPAPPGAYDVSEWQRWDENEYSRLYVLREWRLSGRAYPDVQVVGDEYADGRRVEDIYSESRDVMTPQDARAHAAALIEAAEFLEARRS